MSSTTSRQFVATTALPDFDPIVRAFIDILRREGIAERHITLHSGPARHFLTWLELSGIILETVDSTAIDRFLQHDCDCLSGVPASARLHPWRKRRTSPRLMKFIRFLERTGRVETPGDLDDNICILDGFLEQLRSDGYAPGTIDLHREGCAGLIVWLHLSRIRLCDLTPDVYARFRNRQFICSIPGVFCGQRMRSPGGTYETEIRKFLRYLVAIEQIESFESASEEKVLPEHLERFSVWLERNRDISPGSIRGHIRLIATALPALGDDPRAYDAALIRQVLFEAIEHRSRNCARKLTIAMRMYLRFLVSEGSIAAALIAAVPTVPRWRLSTLPRYIPADDVERTIASCRDDPEGIRDRAILLLLARLALRVGDIVALRLGDIDWDRAEIQIAGKSRWQTVLPLPQDAGDALYTYIATVRPRVDKEQGVPLREGTLWAVFLPQYRHLNRPLSAGSRRGHHLRHPRRSCVPAQPGDRVAQIRCNARRHPIPAPARFSGHHHDLCQDRCRDVAGGRAALDRRARIMTTSIAEEVARFVAIKQKLGYRFTTDARTLSNFARFAAHCNEAFIRSGTAFEWVSEAASPRQRVRRLHSVLLTAALSMPPAGTIAPLTWHYLFGLVAATGLRIGEARALTLDDITPDGLIVRDAKFGKSRMVALHPTTRNALNRYLVARRSETTLDGHLFVLDTGRPPSRTRVSAVFLELAEQTGIREPGATRGPSLHSLLHSFAVRSIENLDPGADPGRHMLALATYLGHANVSETYWYLESTTVLMHGIAEAAEQAHKNGGSHD